MPNLSPTDIVERIWRGDHTVWKPSPLEISDRLGWLTVASAMRERVAGLQSFAKQAASDGCTTAVLCGMGGSSLAPEVFRRTFGVASGALDLIVLDTTHPAAIAGVERRLDLEKTLFIIASKSGGTLETLSHFAYFYDKLPQGKHFVAITDPGSSLESLARSRDFREVFLNPPDIGGRYSALSLFGLVPAALIGADLYALLDEAEAMAARCRQGEDNPGLALGIAMGEAARDARDKLTIVLPDQIAAFGSWVEQLIAESTGKEGVGILPVVDEDTGSPESYGTDRLFVTLDDPLVDIARAGHPVLHLEDAGLGGEMFRWEFATAVAGHVLSINPFDQPNVAEAKEATKKILDAGAVDDPGHDDLGALLAMVKTGDYVCLQAFIEPTEVSHATLQRARLAIRDRHKVATTLGFGPRYLHSTGQLHKGGPNTGVFIQVVDAHRSFDLPIPGQSFTFGTLIDAQALGDLLSLRAHGRRVARVTLDQLTEVL